MRNCFKRFAWVLKWSEEVLKKQNALSPIAYQSCVLNEFSTSIQVLSSYSVSFKLIIIIKNQGGR